MQFYFQGNEKQMHIYHHTNAYIYHHFIDAKQQMFEVHLQYAYIYHHTNAYLSSFYRCKTTIF